MKGDDARLCQRLQRNERAAQEEWLDRFGPRVRALCARSGVAPGDVDDLTQEIWIALFAGVASFRGESQLSTWVYRVALNHILKWREKHHLAPLQLDEDDTRESPSDARLHPPILLERRELGEHVHQALNTLSNEHRDVVVLHELGGLSYAQCAQVLGVPIGTVKSRLSNAFGRLRTQLRPYVFDQSSPETAEPETALPETALPEPERAPHSNARPCPGGTP